MELKEAIKKRASVRLFTDEKVPLEDIKEMITRASLAPSINNSQPWKFIAITNRELIKNMSSVVQNKVQQIFPHGNLKANILVQNKVAKFSTFFMDAPLVIAIIMTPYEAAVDDLLSGTALTHDDINKMRNYPNIQSIGAAIENLLLTSVDLGYGACWLSGLLIARNELEKLLDVQPPLSLAAFVAVGKPKESVRQREKKLLEDIFEIRE
jgi:nitroreductase